MLPAIFAVQIPPHHLRSKVLSQTEDGLAGNSPGATLSTGLGSTQGEVLRVRTGGGSKATLSKRFLSPQRRSIGDVVDYIQVQVEPEPHQRSLT